MRLKSALPAACLAGLVAVAAAGCGGSSGGNSGSVGPAKRGSTVTVSTWGGVWTQAEQKDFADPFTKATGIKVNYQVNGNSPMAPALLQAQSGNIKLDVIDAENAYVLREKNLLAPFPASLIKVLKKTSRPDTVHSDQLNLGNTADVIVCNPQVMKKCPTTPQQFWDVKDYPGPRAIDDTSYMAMAFGLEADGVPGNKVFPMDMNRAITSLKKVKPYVKVWTDSGSQQQQVLDDKEVGAAIMWNGRAYVVKKNNIPGLKIYWNGAFVSQSDGLVVMKGSPNEAGAFAYIKWIAQHPKAQAAWSKELTYPTPTKQLTKLVPPDVRAALPVGHAGVTTLDDKWIADNTTQLQQAWQNFITG